MELKNEMDICEVSGTQLLLDVNIGLIIKNDLKKEGRTVTWLADKIGMGRSNFYYHLRNCDFSLDQLFQISFALNHNYMEPFSMLIGRRLNNNKHTRA